MIRIRPVILFLILLLGFQLSVLTGCGPTYPKERLKESIIKICKKEYNLDVKAETIGKTIAIYAPIENLIDFTFAITAKASEEINDVILSVSRVALSTDAKFEFYCIIARDVRLPEVQIIIIKSVDDVKKFLLNDISRSEYGKRMLIDIRLNPQAQKERAIKEVFEKMGLDKTMQSQVVNDFFNAPPAALGDIGYWNEKFYVKDVTMPEFLAEQIASRIRMEFKDNPGISEFFLVKSSKCTYVSKDGNHCFRLEILAEQKWFKQFAGEDNELAEKVFLTALNVSNDVIHGYRFKDFDYVEIINQADGRSVKVSRDDLEKFRTKKIKFEEIIKGQDLPAGRQGREK